MAKLEFKSLGNGWHNGNDIKKVEVIRITGAAGVNALLYTCFVNIDYDGAANAYGSPGTPTLENMANGGYPNWYNGGIIAVHPDARMRDMDDSSPASFKIGTAGAKLVDYCKLTLDLKHPDKKGRCPVFQQAGATTGYYVSAISHHPPFVTFCDRFKQSSYPDASTVAYGALAGKLATEGKLKVGDQGIALRHGMRRHTAFSFLDSGVTKAGTSKYSAIGECSYKLFLDLGGEEKVPGKTPFNGFAVSYLVFPGGQTAAAQLPLMGQAENAWELPLLIAYGGEKGRAITGEAGDKRLEAARKKGASGMLGALPPNYDTVVAALSAHGFPGDPLALSRGRRDPTTPVLHLGE